MPKHKGKNSKNKNHDEPAKKLLEKEDDQEYARVQKVLGGSRFLLKLNMSDKTVIGKLRGTMRRRKKANWVGEKSVVLIATRDFETEVSDKLESVDILHVYTEQEVRILKRRGDFIEDAKKTLNGLNNEDNSDNDQKSDCEIDIGFDFDDI